jgi:hypothetical protein
VQGLNRVYKCRSVALSTKIVTNFDGAIGPQADEVAVEGSVV